MFNKKDKKDNPEEKEIVSVFDAFSEMMEDIFVMDPHAQGEKEVITSFELKNMFRDLLDINVNDVTITLMKKGFRPEVIAGTAVWKIVRRPK